MTEHTDDPIPKAIRALSRRLVTAIVLFAVALGGIFLANDRSNCQTANDDRAAVIDLVRELEGPENGNGDEISQQFVVPEGADPALRSFIEDQVNPFLTGLGDSGEGGDDESATEQAQRLLAPLDCAVIG